MDTPWGSMDPNSANQLWSRWTFSVYSDRTVPAQDLRENADRWLRQGFGSCGRFRLRFRRNGAVMIEADVEGVPAHDPGYVASVRMAFARFVEQGWGPVAQAQTEVQLLAGDAQDGRPRSQLVVMPTIRRIM